MDLTPMLAACKHGHLALAQKLVAMQAVGTQEKVDLDGSETRMPVRPLQREWVGLFCGMNALALAVLEKKKGRKGRDKRWEASWKDAHDTFSCFFFFFVFFRFLSFSLVHFRSFLGLCGPFEHCGVAACDGAEHVRDLAEIEPRVTPDE
jgi:hypothetical protein